MKVHPYRFLKYCTTLLVLLLLVTNCEKDEHPHFDSSFIEESQNVFDSKTVSIDDVPALKGLLQKTGKSTLGRTTELSCGTIDLDHILQVTHLEDEQTNYSFYLSHQTEDSSAALYNYVITDHDDGTFGELIFEYIPDEAFLSQYSEYTQEAIANFTGQLNIYPYADFCSSSSSKSSSTAEPCPNTGGVISGNSSGGPDTSGNNNDNEGSDGTVGGSSGGGDSDTSEDDNNNDDSNGSDGGGGGGGGSICNAILTTYLSCGFANPPHDGSCYTTVITGWECHAVARSSSAKTEQDCPKIDFAGIVYYRLKRECKKIIDLLNNNDVFKTKLLEISDTTNLNLPYEKSVGLFENQTNLDEHSGNPNQASTRMLGNIPNKYIAYAHNHPQGNGSPETSSIFSFDDLLAIAKTLYTNDLDSDTFVAFLTTKKGTKYALTIHNKTKFLDNFYMYNNTLPSTIEEFQKHQNSKNTMKKLFWEYFNPNNPNRKIKETDTDNENVLKQFLNFMDSADAGITLFEADDTFDTFSKVTLDSSNPKRKPCKN